jgi:orotate phosphoribosyltransferase-like protein
MPLLPKLSPPDELKRVAELARTGATEENIAAELQISLKRLQKRYRREIERNRATAKNEMLAHLYETAKSGSNSTAAMFWVKSQCGWRDTGSSSESTVVLQPIININRRPAS